MVEETKMPDEADVQNCPYCGSWNIVYAGDAYKCENCTAIFDVEFFGEDEEEKPVPVREVSDDDMDWEDEGDDDWEDEEDTPLGS